MAACFVNADYYQIELYNEYLLRFFSNETIPEYRGIVSGSFR